MQENDIDLKSVLLLKTFFYFYYYYYYYFIYNLSVNTIHIFQMCICNLNMVQWDGFNTLSGCIRPEGRLLFTPVEWWSHIVT